eukprot:GHVO01021476.1.p3 GENE.GHVO01021476.1~~GHVO01021476.1.p3  ORF type:complete len:107 (-),score=13.75 GHVO01021476.1:630-950(-)
MARNSPFCLERSLGEVSNLTLENTSGMPPSIDLYDTDFINILSKLRINEDCEVERLWLDAKIDKQVAAALEHVGRVKRMWLYNYAVSILPKLRAVLQQHYLFRLHP